MKRFGLIVGAVLLLLIGAVFGFAPGEAIPVYAQDALANAPDLSGIHVYFSEVNAEASRFDRSDAGISRFAGLLRYSGAELFTLEWRKGIPSDADLIVIVGPSGGLSADMIARLWSYLESGGRVLIAADAFDDRGGTSGALSLGGFFGLTWADLGVRALENVIVTEGESREVAIVERDRRSDEVVFEYNGPLTVLETTFLTRRVNETHPITAGLLSLLADDDDDDEMPANLNSLFFSGSRSIEIDAAIDVGTVTPLIFTDNPLIYGESDFNRYLGSGYHEYNIDADTARGNLILGASYERVLTGARMVVFGDADVMRNGTGFAVAPSYSDGFVFPVNAQLMLRTAAWLLDRELSNIALIAPGPTGTPTLTPTPLPTETPEPVAAPES